MVPGRRLAISITSHLLILASKTYCSFALLLPLEIKMRSFILTSVVLSIAAAAPAPAPQDIDFDLAYALPNPSYTTAAGATAQIVTYNPSSILASAQSQITAAQTDASDATSTAALEKRTACAPQPSGYGPVPSPDTPSAFSSYSVFASAASAAPTPNGYSQTFKNLQGSNK